MPALVRQFTELRSLRSPSRTSGFRRVLITTLCLLMAVPPSTLTPVARAQEAPLNELQRQAALDPIVMITGKRSTVEVVERLSKVIELKDRIKRVDGFDPNIIDVKALSPNRIRVQALVQGVTTLVLTSKVCKTYGRCLMPGLTSQRY